MSALKFCEVSPNVMEVFKITKLNKLFDIQDGEEKAIASFDKKGLVRLSPNVNTTHKLDKPLGYRIGTVCKIGHEIHDALLPTDLRRIRDGSMIESAGRRRADPIEQQLRLQQIAAWLDRGHADRSTVC